MKTKPRAVGKIVAITKQGATVRLDDGREGFVSTADYFWNAWVGQRNLSAGDSRGFDMLGMMPDSRVSLGFEPIRGTLEPVAGIDRQYVTSLEEVRAECPNEVGAIEQHKLFHADDEEGYVGWMRVARLLENCHTDDDDGDGQREEDGQRDEDGQLEDELVDLMKTLVANFKKNTELELMLTTLGWESCDRTDTLPLAGTAGWIDSEGRCCVFTVHGMEALTAAGQRFLHRSELRAWVQCG